MEDVIPRIACIAATERVVDPGQRAAAFGAAEDPSQRKANDCRREQDYHHDVQRDYVHVVLPRRCHAWLGMFQQASRINQLGRPAGQQHEALKHQRVDQRAEHELPV